MIKHKKGGVSVTLYQPFELDGKEITEVTFLPVKWDHLIRWQEGRYRDTIALMAALSGLSAAVIRSIEFPDVNRVNNAFYHHMPESIRADIDNGFIPPPMEGVDDEPIPESRPIETAPVEDPVEELPEPPEEMKIVGMEGREPPTVHPEIAANLKKMQKEALAKDAKAGLRPPPRGTPAIDITDLDTGTGFDLGEDMR